MRQHGTRAKYVIEHCRCHPCKEANRAYARQRQRHQRRVEYGLEAPQPAYVDTSEAREHLNWLSSIGIGKRTVHQVTGVSLSAIQQIRQGTQTRARATTVDKILAVGRHKSHARIFVNPQRAWAMLDAMIDAGLTRAEISRRLGNTTPSIQYSRTRPMYRSTEARIEAVYKTMFRNAA